ncbi:hypothetical protein EI94DRAFT_77315 [Lactarius quietus]|nr:hypothetical protein EI94DRAFT_77315 [Lactarius quietus]
MVSLTCNVCYQSHIRFFFSPLSSTDSHSIKPRRRLHPSHALEMLQGISILVFKLNLVPIRWQAVDQCRHNSQASTIACKPYISGFQSLDIHPASRHRRSTLHR